MSKKIIALIDTGAHGLILDPPPYRRGKVVTVEFIKDNGEKDQERGRIKSVHPFYSHLSPNARN